MISGEGTGGGIPTTCSSILKGHEGALLAVRFNGDGRYCLTCGRDRTLRLWNPHRGLHIKTYSGHGREVRDVAVTSDNARLASCGGDRQIFYWDVASGRIIRKFRGHDSEVNAIKFNEVDSVSVSAGYDKSVRVWDCRSNSFDPIQGKSVCVCYFCTNSIDPIHKQIMVPFSDSATSVFISGNEIMAASVDGSICTFDIRMGKRIKDQLGHPITSISLSYDANCILASCLDSKLRLLDRNSGELLNEYQGHSSNSTKSDSCFSNSDEHVVSGSEDGFVYFWEIVEAKMFRLKAHLAAVTGVSYHSSEACFLTCSVDGTAKVWK